MSILSQSFVGSQGGLTILGCISAFPVPAPIISKSRSGSADIAPSPVDIRISCRGVSDAVFRLMQVIHVYKSLEPASEDEPYLDSKRSLN